MNSIRALFAGLALFGLALAAALTGCGGAPPDEAAPTQSALTGRGPGFQYLGSYTCNGTTYNMGVSFTQTVQSYPWGGTRIRDSYGYSLDSSVNSTTLSCPGTDMVLRPSGAYTNPAAISCYVVARLPGGGTGSTAVTVPISGIVYWPDAAPIGWPGIPVWQVSYGGGPQGYSPGWCAAESFIFG